MVQVEINDISRNDFPYLIIYIHNYISLNITFNGFNRLRNVEQILPITFDIIIIIIIFYSYINTE